MQQTRGAPLGSPFSPAVCPGDRSWAFGATTTPKLSKVIDCLVIEAVGGLLDDVAVDVQLAAVAAGTGQPMATVEFENLWEERSSMEKEHWGNSNSDSTKPSNAHPSPRRPDLRLQLSDGSALQRARCASSLHPAPWTRLGLLCLPERRSGTAARRVDRDRG